MIKRILVGLGGTSFTPVAIRRAVELAHRHDAEVTGVTVVDLARLTHIGPAPIGASGAAEELREYRLEVTRRKVEQAVADFEAACREAGIRYAVDNETGDPFVLMTSLSRYHDLMIFGLRSVFDYGFGIDAPDALAQLIGCGVRPIVAEAAEFRPIRRVLLTHSGSYESTKTIKRFIQLRLWPDVALRILTCEHPEAEAQQMLRDAAEYCQAHGFHPDTQYLPGSPAEEILAHAEQWDADLIVLGNSCRSYLLRKIFGETVIHVLENSTRPLFLSH